MTGNAQAAAGPRPTEVASRNLINAVVTHGRRVFSGEDVDHYLDAMQANASYGGGDILLRSDARRVEVLEEFLHGSQERIGLFTRLSRVELELHVKDFMIRHHVLLGITADDVEWIRRSRAMYQ
jgi:hypothetical protein